MSARLSTGLVLVRAGYGALLIARPELIAAALLGRPTDRRERLVARLLGARHLGQALASGRRPAVAMLALGVEVDLLHAASMAATALVARRHRRAALTSAGVAGSFALAGLAGTVSERRRPLPAGPGGRREVWADLLARLLVPGYRPSTAASETTE